MVSLVPRTHWCAATKTGNRGVLDGLDLARLVQQAIALSFCQRGAEDVVHGAVVPEVDGTAKPWNPEQQDDADEEGHVLDAHVID